MPAPDPRPWRVLVITGGLGAGKTSVAVEVGALLDRRGTPCSVVDLDQLCWTTPAPGSDRTVADVLHGSLAAILPVHAAAGVGHLVLPRLLSDHHDLEGLRGALPPSAQVLVVALTACAEERERRLRARDSASTLEGHLHEVASLLPAPGVADVEVATDARSVADVAAEVLRLWDADEG